MAVGYNADVAVSCQGSAILLSITKVMSRFKVTLIESFLPVSYRRPASHASNPRSLAMPPRHDLEYSRERGCGLQGHVIPQLKEHPHESTTGCFTTSILVQQPD